jgi:hypothetical protein
LIAAKIKTMTIAPTIQTQAPVLSAAVRNVRGLLAAKKKLTIGSAPCAAAMCEEENEKRT